MATAFFASEKEKETARQIEALIDDGILPTPPTTGQEANTCASCGKYTMLTVPSPQGRVCAGGCEVAA